MKKHQPFPDKRSRDLFPKPYSNHYSERFLWPEPDHGPTTKAMMVAAAIGFTAPVIISVAWYVIHLIITQ